MKKGFTYLLVISLTFFLSKAKAQEKTISGVVRSSTDNSPLPGVNVIVEGTSTGTVTDFEGNYRLQVEATAKALVFSFIGFESQTVDIGNRTVINVSIVESLRQLEELVVTGYSTKEERNIIGSITSVTPEQFKNMPVQGMDQALQGQAAGVMVTKSSGEPGGGIMVRVRGNSSISGSNRPLYVVDGMPVADGSLTGRSFGGQNDNALATINPSDIESIEVLKDASAKAIYGSRAANGVVLITTKRGSRGGRTKINVDIKRGMIDLPNKIDLLNSTELLELQRESLVNAEDDPDNAGIPGITNSVSTDWVDQVTRTGILQEYQVSAGGGSESTRFYISAAYRDEEGVVLNNRFQRYTLTSNVDHNATKKLSMGVNLKLARTENDRVKGDNFLDGVYSGAVKSLPYYEPYDENGNLYAPGDAGYAGFPNFNPVGQALEPRFKTFANKIIGGIYAQYEFIPRLRFKTSLNIDFTDTKEDQFEPTTTAIGGFLPSVLQQGLGIFSASEIIQILNTNLLTYDTRIAEQHQIGALLGAEFLKRDSRGNSVTGLLFPSDDFTYIASAGLVNSGTSNRVESGLASFFSEVNYGFREKYLISLNARFDGSSRFGDDNQWGFFPAVSVGWRVSEEPFMSSMAFIDGLKLRASYGLTGNERIGNFQFLGTWVSAPAYNQVPAVVPATLENNDLKWESTAEFDVGFDLDLFLGRVQITYDYYHNITNDLLLAETLPYTTGFSSVQGNLGEVRNEGMEFTLNTINIDRKFSWRTSFNISGNRNRVVELATDEPQFAGYQTFTNSTHIIQPGSPLGTYWGLKFEGVDPATGDAIYTDINNDGAITADDGTVIGNAQPDFIGGFTNTFAYGNFDISIFLQFSSGNEIINFSNTSLLNSGQSLTDNQVRQALERWQNEGDITSVPRYESGNVFNNRFSDRFVEDGSYLRIKNLTFSYSFPSALMNRWNMGGIRLYASGTNLFTWDNYSAQDPEVNSLDGSTAAQGLDFFTLPQVRTLLIGLNLEF